MTEQCILTELSPSLLGLGGGFFDTDISHFILPQTPGISVSKKPPPKPRKGGDNSVSIHCSVILFYLKLQVYPDIPGVCGKIK
jgi:hypothetical protein